MVQGKKSKNELLKKLKKFEKGWAESSSDFRIDFKQLESFGQLVQGELFGKMNFMHLWRFQNTNLKN